MHDHNDEMANDSSPQTNLGSYRDFVDSKLLRQPPTGMDVDEIPDMRGDLYDWQWAITRWALRKGRSAIFADCGLGKTPMQLTWAHAVADHTDGRVLVVAPFAVVDQTIQEGKKFDCPVYRADSDESSSVEIVNYERLHTIDPDPYEGVVLDESSILKSHDGTYRNNIIDAFQDTPWKLACTATPAPNDHMELTNHAEFLGVMERQEVLASFFTHDSSNTQQWRLKGHARDEFWRWVASWAVSITHPEDIGYEDDRFDLPDLNIHESVVEVDRSEDAPDDMLFRPEAQGLSEIRDEQRRTTDARAERVASLVDDCPDESWIIWCYRNAEAEAACERIDDAVEVRGSDSPQEKAEALRAFADGDIRVLVTKPSIAGFGLNWQHCSNVAFLGLSYSYEQFYQAVRRCWRFGQSDEVNAYMVCAETEGHVLQSIKQKRRDSAKMHQRMVDAMDVVDIESATALDHDPDDYEECQESGLGWSIYQGDCVEVITQEVDANSIGCSVFSPPFSSLYTYNNSPRDMGNSQGDDEFFEHFGYLIDELYRVTMPGRLCCVHLSNLTTTKAFDGQIGLRDFRGDVIDHFVERDWIYHSEVTIWKDPVTAMQRTKALGLLYKQLRKDSAMSRQGLADYVVVFRKPGENPKPIEHTEESFPLEEWQKLASPTWQDIEQTDVLDYRGARDDDDEKHICPLQLEVIRRCLRLWSAEGDTVLDPFTGIGSTGYVACDMDREFVGVELKDSYFQQAVGHLTDLTTPDDQMDLVGDFIAAAE